VRGAVLRGEPHIVGINELWVDFPATGHVLLAMHHDRPGMIGRVGTLLGNADVNISFMHVGRRAPRTEAIMALGTDEPTTPDLQAQIGAVADIYWLKAITL
jgi:L-serine deaminase